MDQVDILRAQHKEILKITNLIKPLLMPETLAKNSSIMRAHLVRLTGTLRVHLTMEDTALYPSLLKHHDLTIKTTAQAFMEEMGGLVDVFNTYAIKWKNEEISAHPETFIQETHDLFAALLTRIDREDHQLYPLLDKDRIEQEIA